MPKKDSVIKNIVSKFKNRIVWKKKEKKKNDSPWYFLVMEY